MRAEVIATACGLLLAACSSDPYMGVAGLDDSCIGDHRRDPGPSCTAQPLELTLDGAPDEWPAGLDWIPGCIGCTYDGAVFHANVTRAEGFVQFFIHTINAPSVLDGVYYAMGLRNHGMIYDDPRNTHVQILVGTGGSVALFNGFELQGLPVEAAFGATGIEVRVPVDSLPFAGSAILAAWLAQRDGDRFVFYDRPEVWSSACWDPRSPDDPCGFF